MATTILNSANCATDLGNTGQTDCAFDPKLLVGGFLIPPNAEIPASALVSEAALQTFLAGKILAPKGQRWYPLPNGAALTDNSADVTIQQLSGGASFPVKDGDYDITQQYLDGKLCLSNQLQKFKGTNYKYLAIDAEGTIIGTKNFTKDGIAGIKLIYFYPYPHKFASATEVAQYRYRLAFTPDQINRFIAFAKTSEFNPLDLQGLKTVGIKQIDRPVGTPGVITFAVKTCGGSNLSDTFPTELTVPAAWVVTNATTGNAVTVSAVTIDPNGNYVLTLLTTDPDYNVTSNGMKVTLVAPTVLDTTYGVTGYEGAIGLTQVPN